MVAFDARSQKQVPRLFAAGLAAGGFDEGQPGFRDIYYAHFFDDRNEPWRDDK